MSVDVVIPTFNPTTLDRAVASAAPFADRIIVVDDGSDHPVRAEAHVIRIENAGPSAARNAGIEASDAEWILFLDDDDRLLDSTSAHLDRVIGTDGAGGVGARRDASGRVRGVPDDWSDVLTTPGDAFRPIQLFNASGLVMRRSLGVRFDEDLRIGEDRDLVARLASVGPVILSPEVIVETGSLPDRLTSSTHLDRRVRDHLVLLERWDSPWLKEMTDWLVGQASRHASPEAWASLVEATRARGWRVPVRRRLRRMWHAR